tara:strand:- start:323 stop:553 length:231 start_codon:yes stop_codon:yes gene_type:complete
MRWKILTPLKARIEGDNYLFLQFFIAEKLGMTLAQLRASMSLEELQAWSAYCSVKSDREQKEIERSRQEAQYRRVR